MPDVIYEISRKGLGMTTVTGADGVLAGILTDGDLRRLMQKRRQRDIRADGRGMPDARIP